VELAQNTTLVEKAVNMVTGCIYSGSSVECTIARRTWHISDMAAADCRGKRSSQRHAAGPATRDTAKKATESVKTGDDQENAISLDNYPDVYGSDR